MRALPLLLSLALAPAACGGSEDAGGYAAPVGPDGRPVPLGCEHAVPSTAIEAPAELIVPAGTRVIVASAEPNPQNEAYTIVEGYVEEVPGRVIAAFDRTPGVEVLFSEDEQIEADVLIAEGGRRNFWKMVRACLAASRFSAAVGGAAAVTRAGRSQARRPPPRRGR